MKFEFNWPSGFRGEDVWNCWQTENGHATTDGRKEGPESLIWILIHMKIMYLLVTFKDIFIFSSGGHGVTNFGRFVCLICFLRPINNLSVIKGRIFLGWTSTKIGLMFLLKDTTQWRRWGLNLRPFGLESNTLPLSSLNFGRGHHEEQFCKIILNLKNYWLRRCHLKTFLI